MNVYAMLSSGLGPRDASALGARLSAWHDAMVAHERRLRQDGVQGGCHDECPHADARALWAEAVATFGARADELTFLRSRAQASRVGPGAGPEEEAFDADETPARGVAAHDAEASP